MTLSLRQAIRSNNPCVIALTGAGGKTTAMFQLARESSEHSQVVLSASTHLGVWQVTAAEKHLTVESEEALLNLEDQLARVTLLTGGSDGDRTKPLESTLLHWLAEFCRAHALPMLIEADGSRQKPLKAWADHEPAIPQFADQVIHVAGLLGLGKPLTEEHVHRPEIFARLSGLKMGELITPQGLIKVLTHAGGGQKNIPAGARRVILLNQADTPELQSLARGMADELLSHFDAVIVSSLAQGEICAVHEPVAGIILAAGEARRFGRPKQLLDWKGQPFIRAITKTALEAGLAPVIVVTGANRGQVEAAIQDLNVTIVRNEAWQSGQASSIRRGVEALSPPPSLPQSQQQAVPHESEKPQVGSRGATAGAAIFLLADQPQLDTSILRALVEKHAQGLYPAVAPLVMDRRANPVLFDQVTFPDLMQLEGDIGGRAIFHKHHVEYLPWHDDRLLLDVDTEAQYQRLISDETL